MTKSLNGQGAIRQRPDGRWEGRLTRERAGGKRQRISVYGSTAAEAQRKLNAKVREEERGVPEPVASGRLTFGSFLEEWLEGLKTSPRVRPSSWQNYSNALRVRIIPALGHLRLTKLSHEDLERYYEATYREGLSRNYIKTQHAIIHRALKVARRKDLISGDPGGLVDFRNLLRRERRERRERDRALTLEELVSVLALLETHPQRAFFTTALLSGLRFGELAALRWQDVDLEAGGLIVERGLVRVSARTARELGLPELAMIGDPKSDTSFRSVALPTEVTEALKTHRAAQKARFLLYGRPWSDAELVFQNARFHPAQQTWVNKSWHLIQDAVGIPRDRHIPLHGTRSTFASLEVGARQERVTQQRMGHATATMTRHYQSVWDQAGNVRNIEDTLAQARTKAGRAANE